MNSKTIGFPDPETTPDYGVWTWDGEKWVTSGSGGNGGGGDGGSYDDTQIKADLATETQARADGDTALQGQIDDLDFSDAVEEAPEDSKQYARKDAGWSEVQATGGGAVDSVNGQTGVVILNAADVGALPSNYSAPVDSVNDKTGVVVLNAADVGALPSNYSAPVDSVNNKTGVVVLNAADVGALPSNYSAPVNSVNGKTGVVVLNAADVGAQVAGSYAASNHNHSGVYQPAGSYAASNHTHDYAASNHTHNYAASNHTHDYAASNHSHSGYVSTSGNTTIAGTLYATDFVASSDKNLKDNITVVPVGLIDSIKGREWDWKDSGVKGSGVIAQEIEEVFPHLVHTDDEGMKSVAYNGLIAYLIEELKDCRERISALEAK